MYGLSARTVGRDQARLTLPPDVSAQVAPPVQAALGLLGGIGLYPEELLPVTRTAERRFGSDCPQSCPSGITRRPKPPCWPLRTTGMGMGTRCPVSPAHPRNTTTIMATVMAQ